MGREVGCRCWENLDWPVMEIFLQPTTYDLQPTNHRCTRPDPPPCTNCSTSSRVQRLKSPGIECFRQDAATANSRTSWWLVRIISPKINPPANLSPPPTRTTISVIS